MFTMLTVIISPAGGWHHFATVPYPLHNSALTRGTYAASKLPRGFGGQQRHGVQLHLEALPLCLLPAFFVLHLTNKQTDTGEWALLPTSLLQVERIFL